MPMHNLIEYGDNYLNTSGSLWKYCKDEPSLNNANAIVDFNGSSHNSKSFKYKQKITGVTDVSRAKNVEIMAPLKYLSNFWRTLEMSLINCEINLILTWSEKCIIASNTAANQATTFAITDTKFMFQLQLDQLKIMQNYCNS